MTFPEIYQRKVSCFNDVSMMIDVFHSNRLLRRCFDYFLSFFSLLFQFFPFVCKKTIILYFFMLVLIKYVSKNKYIYFFDDVIVNCITACSGSKMAAQNLKWLLFDVIVTPGNVIIDTSSTQSVKLMTY